MPKLPVIAGNYTAKIQQNNFGDVPVGTSVTLNLVTDLPVELVQIINSDYPVYAQLGCRKNGYVEFVLIEKGSYKTQDRSLRIVRGQPYSAYETGGQTIKHVSPTTGSLELKFGELPPLAYKSLVDTVIGISENAQQYLSNNLPKANTIQAGLVKVSYTDPAGTSKVLTIDNPLLVQLVQRLLNIDTGNATLLFDGNIDSQTQTRLSQLGELINLFLLNETKFNNFKTWYNNQNF